MSMSHAFSIAPSARQAADDLSPPAWAAELVGQTRSVQQTVDHTTLITRTNDHATLVSVRASGAAELDAAAFERTTVQTYKLIRRALSTHAANIPVRFWNYIPAIHDAMDGDRDRYMVFNAGRFKAFCEWFGGSDQLSGRVATASGVGHFGRDLVIHCLAATAPGKAIENPRQIPAFRYSKRYGPLPPCFARATIVNDLLPGGASVLVGGTASIAGERTVHRNQLAGQFRETLENLSSLVTAAGVGGDPLAAFSEVRIYHPRKRDAAAIARLAAKAFPRASRPQLMQADLCRSELLVEIEGVARLD